MWILSDEGDGSRRVANNDGDAENYIDLFRELAAASTLGAYRELTGAPDEDCAEVDVGAVLAAGMAGDLE